MDAKLVVNLAKICVRLTLSILFELVALFRPIRRGLYLFGTINGHFEGNAKYLFLRLSREPGCRIVWLSDDQAALALIRSLGYEAVPRLSWRGFALALSAEWFFVNHNSSDVFPFKLRRTRLFNLWHGSPIKKMGFDSRIDARSLRFVNYYRNINRFLVGSEFFLPFYRTCLRLPEERYFVGGQPRVDGFFSLAGLGDSTREEETRAARSRIGVPVYKRMVAYIPTFRDDLEARTAHRLRTAELIDAFAASSISDEWTLVIRAHPLGSGVDPVAESSVLDLSGQVDVQDILIGADILITDYSSVIFDFLVLSRPILIFDFDREGYMTGRDGFYFDYLSELGLESRREASAIIERCMDISQGGSFPTVREPGRFNLPGSCERILAFLKVDRGGVR